MSANPEKIVLQRGRAEFIGPSKADSQKQFCAQSQ